MLSTTADSDDKAIKPEEHPITTPQKLPSGRELMQQSLEMARLAAEIERKQEALCKAAEAQIHFRQYASLRIRFLYA